MDYKTVLAFIGGLLVGSGATYAIIRYRDSREMEKLLETEDISEDEFLAAEHIREYAEKNQPETVETEPNRDVIYFPNELEKQKEKIFRAGFKLEEVSEDLAETTVTTTGEIIKAAEVISPIQFFEDEYDDDGELIEKAEDPLIYFADGVLINTDDAEPYEPVSEETCEEYLNLEEVTKHFGEYGEENVVYIRCFEKPVTDYKIIKENVSFMNSRWYSGEGEV